MTPQGGSEPGGAVQPSGPVEGIPKNRDTAPSSGAPLSPPGAPDNPASNANAEQTGTQNGVAVSWIEKAAAVAYCIFCIEIGLFLLVYPWMSGWDKNYLVHMKPEFTEFLTSVRFKGAVSGLGILNLFAAASEIVALRRYSSR